MKLIQIFMLGFLTSCGFISIPDEHIEIDFDFKSTHAKEVSKEIEDPVN